MREQVAGFVEGAFMEVLSNYAFMFGDRVEAESLTCAEDACFLHVWIDILSNGKSHLGVVIPMSLARTITANVLGIEEDDPVAQERSEDAVKEMINVLCGHLRTLLAQESDLFEAAIPCATPVSADEWNSIKDSKESLAFLIEDQPLLLILSMEGRD